MNECLSVENLSATYNGVIVLNNLSLEIQPGDFIGVCGPNGAGKSTLLKLLSSGNVDGLKIVSFNRLPSLGNKQIQLMKKKERAKKIAFMAQNESSIWNYTVEDYILNGRFSYTINGNYSAADRSKVYEIMNFMNIMDLASKTVNGISGGEFQKVRIARALCQEPEFLLLDEPGSNLDFVYEPQLMELLKKIVKEKKIGLVISIHDINLAHKYVDKVLLLASGRDCIFGKTEEVVNTDNLKKIYGVDFLCKEVKSYQLLQ